MKVNCPACGERQDDFGRTSFDCARCGTSLAAVRPADAMAASREVDATSAVPFGWAARGWLGFGAVTHVIGAVVLVASLFHHDSADDWAPSLAGTITGAILAWLGFLLLVVGLTAYGVELVSARLASAETSSSLSSS